MNARFYLSFDTEIAFLLANFALTRHDFAIRKRDVMFLWTSDVICIFNPLVDYRLYYILRRDVI